MKTILASAIAAVLLSSCAQNYYQVSGEKLKAKMQVIDKTDYDKIENNHKEHVEHKRQHRYHTQANQLDKKLNHTDKSDQLNQKKGWDGSFGFY